MVKIGERCAVPLATRGKIGGRMSKKKREQLELRIEQLEARITELEIGISYLKVRWPGYVPYPYEPYRPYCIPVPSWDDYRTTTS